MNSPTSPVRVSLPLFPLPLVLFPDGALPLRIFEVRYLDMIARHQREGLPFGVVCLDGAGSEVARPAIGPAGGGFVRERFAPIGTLARIDALERPQAGLLHVRCTGMQRFRVCRSEQQRYGLWVGELELLADDALVAPPDDLAFARDALVALLRQVEESLALSARRGEPVEAELPLHPPYRWDDCGWLANRWCEILPLELQQKQRLMAIDSPLLRLELVGDALRELRLAPPPGGERREG